MENEEKEVVLFWLQRWENELEPNEKKLEVMQKFLKEFEIEPSEVTPTRAKRVIEVHDEQLIERFLDCFELLGYNRDADYIAVKMSVERCEDCENTEGWELSRGTPDHGKLFRKVKDGYAYHVWFTRLYYDDDC